MKIKAEYIIEFMNKRLVFECKNRSEFDKTTNLLVEQGFEVYCQKPEELDSTYPVRIYYDASSEEVHYAWGTSMININKVNLFYARERRM